MSYFVILSIKRVSDINEFKNRCRSLISAAAVIFILSLSIHAVM